MSANQAAPDWLAQLSPDHAPPPATWWPPAPGWWMVLVLLIVIVTAFVVWLRSPRRTLRRAALRELNGIANQRADTASTARAIQSVLRRYAVAVFGVERVGRLTGENWLAFVMTHSAGRLDAQSGRSLWVAAFGTPAQDDREQWLCAAKRFVQMARRRSGSNVQLGRSGPKTEPRPSGSKTEPGLSGGVSRRASRWWRAAE